MRLKIDWPSLIVGRKFTVFALFTLYLRAISRYKPPGGLIFGGAYTWRGLFSEFYDIRFCLAYPENFTALLRSGLSDKRFYGSGTISYKIDLIINMTL